MPILILIIKKLNLKIQNIYIVIISINVYYAVYCLKLTQVFIILIKNILYQAEKEAKAKNSFKKSYTKKILQFFRYFCKKNLDIFYLY